jgi:hypothetical protein
MSVRTFFQRPGPRARPGVEELEPRLGPVNRLTPALLPHTAAVHRHVGGNVLHGHRAARADRASVMPTGVGPLNNKFDVAFLMAAPS